MPAGWNWGPPPVGRMCDETWTWPVQQGGMLWYVMEGVVQSGSPPQGGERSQEIPKLQLPSTFAQLKVRVICESSLKTWACFFNDTEVTWGCYREFAPFWFCLWLFGVFFSLVGWGFFNLCIDWNLHLKLSKLIPSESSAWEDRGRIVLISQ